VRPLPGSTPVRQMIVSEALTYLERLSRDPMVDDALRLELARGYLRIGEIQGRPSVANLGDRQGALASFRQALDLLRPLTTKATPDQAAVIELVHAELAIAGTASVAGRRDEAHAAATDAVARAESLVRRDPKDDVARRLVASAYFQHALLLSAPASLVAWQKAGEVFEALLVDRPEDPDRQRNVALVQKYIGTYYEHEDDLARALPYYTRALELDERRLAANPSNRTTQFDVAADLSNVALAQWEAGNLTLAAADFERCLQLREQLLQSDPKDVLARSRLAVIHSRLADLYVKMNRGAAALEHARQGVALRETLAPIDWQHEEGLGNALQTLGFAEKHAGHPAEACQAFRRSAAFLQDLTGKDDLSPDGRRRVSETLSKVRQQLLQCVAPLTARPK
jgi:eukaryotic-like serine/threonine-protein kinase